VNVAVLSLTRDRLEYTKHCFQTLWDNAGIEFDHYVTDQGSTDGTVEWLHANTDATVYAYPENVGIVPALNMMLDDVLAQAEYDVIVKVDNDCELLTPDTLRVVCEAVMDRGAILSPHIHGLRQPPKPTRVVSGVSVTDVIGGIFMATPAEVFSSGYRHPRIPTLDGEDFNLCQWYRARGGYVGYVDGFHANHYETTDGQHARFPDYFARREQERQDAWAAVA
jgi:glycosyltransferase involved in cell wall biosynthesis